MAKKAKSKAAKPKRSISKTASKKVAGKASTKAASRKAAGAKKAPSKKASPKQPPSRKASPKQASPKQAPSRKASPKQASPKKAAPNKPSRQAAEHDQAHGHDHDHHGHDHDHDHDHDHEHVHEVAWHEVAGKTMIIQIVGDAEAYFFDFAKLDQKRRGELIEHHLAAWDHRQRAAGKNDWTDHFVPFALVGESIPPSVRGRLDLSAPHEGLLLHHAASGAVLYAASKDDEKLAILAPDLDSLSTTESDITEVVDPTDQSYAYAVDRAISQGFTLGQIEELMQTMGASLTMV